MKSQFVAALCLCALMAIIAYWTQNVWNECRETHTFMYCYYTVFK